MTGRRKFRDITDTASERVDVRSVWFLGLDSAGLRIGVAGDWLCLRSPRALGGPLGREGGSQARRSEADLIEVGKVEPQQVFRSTLSVACFCLHPFYWYGEEWGWVGYGAIEGLDNGAKDCLSEVRFSGPVEVVLLVTDGGPVGDSGSEGHEGGVLREAI